MGNQERTQIGFIIQQDSSLNLVLQELVFIESGIITSHSWDGIKNLVATHSVPQLYIEYSAVSDALSLCHEVRSLSEDTGLVLFCDYQEMNEIFKEEDPEIDWILLKPVGVRHILFTIQRLRTLVENKKQVRHLTGELKFARTRLEELVTLIDQKYPGGLEALSTTNDAASSSPSRKGVEQRYAKLQDNLSREDDRDRP